MSSHLISSHLISSHGVSRINHILSVHGYTTITEDGLEQANQILDTRGRGRCELVIKSIGMESLEQSTSVPFATRSSEERSDIRTLGNSGRP